MPFVYPRAPDYLPTCTFNVPPVFTGGWDEDSWRKWVALSCQCDMHEEWRAKQKGTP